MKRCERLITVYIISEIKKKYRVVQLQRFNVSFAAELYQIIIYKKIILFQSDILYFKFGFKGVIIAEKAQLSSKFQVGITFSNKQLLVHKHRWILFKCFREQAASWPQGATGEERTTGYVQSC